MCDKLPVFVTCFAVAVLTAWLLLAAYAEIALGHECWPPSRQVLWVMSEGCANHLEANNAGK